MPLYSFATYADYSEEWAIEADSIEDARRKVGTDPGGSWLWYAICLDAEPVECREKFLTGDDGKTPHIKEITPATPWAWRAAHKDQIERSLKQNIAAIAVELHQHRLFDDFYARLGEKLNGFIGIYDFCIAMANALTEWEIANGLVMAYENHAVSWIEVIEEFVDDVITNACYTGATPDLALIIDRLQCLQPAASP